MFIFKNLQVHREMFLYLEMGGSKQKEAKGLYVCTTSDEVKIIIFIESSDTKRNRGNAH